LRLSRYVIVSIAQVLGSLMRDGVGVLLYKHLGQRPQDLANGVLCYVEAIESADAGALAELLKELVRESSAIRAGARPSTSSTATGGNSTAGSCTTAG